jgi:hypothetical protein
VDPDYAAVAPFPFAGTIEKVVFHVRPPQRGPGAFRPITRTGETVTLSLPLTMARIDCPEPADHHMTLLTDVDIGSGAVRFAKDHVGLDYHNDGHSHTDALCHVAFRRRTLRRRAGQISDRERGIGRRDRCAQGGLVARGVLLDVPRARGLVDRAGGAHLPRGPRGPSAIRGRGTGRRHRAGPHRHARRLDELEPWDTGKAKAGLTRPRRHG